MFTVVLSDGRVWVWRQLMRLWIQLANKALCNLVVAANERDSLQYSNNLSHFSACLDDMEVRKLMDIDHMTAKNGQYQGLFLSLTVRWWFHNSGVSVF